MDRCQSSKDTHANKNVCKFYRIADFDIKLCYNDRDNDCSALLPSLNNFKSNMVGDKVLLSFNVDGTIEPTKKDNKKRIDVFDTGNGDIVVDEIEAGGYQLIIKDTYGRSCCLLQTNKDFSSFRCALNGGVLMRSFGLNNALMIAFALRSSFYDTLLIHASCVRHKGYAYAFTAESGTGKSTHTGLWLRHIEGCDLLNDDNPIIRIIDNMPYVYGSPWSGKTPCYRNIKAKLGAITVIDRSLENSIERLSPIESFTRILPACSSMKWDKTIFKNTYDSVIKLIEYSSSNYILHCRPDKEAAFICHQTIAQ
jgi:hypothetical protein